MDDSATRYCGTMREMAPSSGTATSTELVMTIESPSDGVIVTSSWYSPGESGNKTTEMYVGFLVTDQLFASIPSPSFVMKDSIS